jgi:hypothetical protein
LRLVWFAAAFVLCAGVAAAAPAGSRVVLVDPDPELRRAMTTALAPWKLEVITDPNPVDAASAPARADAMSARFVVWRESGNLVVFDRQRGDTVSRQGTGGELDPVAAASAALTVKTLMRLPLLDGETRSRSGEGTGTEIRVQAGFATRFAFGADTVVGGRFIGAVMIRPTSDSGWRFGLLGDTGTDNPVEKAGFKGAWSDWGLLLIASYTIVRSRFEIEPYLAGGITRSSLVGVEMTNRHVEHDTLAALRGGIWVRRRIGMWTLGGTAGFEGVPGTPTYTRLGNRQDIFTVPSTGIAIGVVVAADLGR